MKQQTLFAAAGWLNKVSRRLQVGGVIYVGHWNCIRRRNGPAYLAERKNNVNAENTPSWPHQLAGRQFWGADEETGLLPGCRQSAWKSYTRNNFQFMTGNGRLPELA